MGEGTQPKCDGGQKAGFFALLNWGLLYGTPDTVIKQDECAGNIMSQWYNAAQNESMAWHSLQYGINSHQLPP